MVEETVQAYAAGLEGKIVIAATNKVGVPQVNCLEALTREIPRALVFRAFNHLGWENFASPTFHDVQAELFFCGADGPARQQVEKLIDQIGIRPIYIGGLDQAHLLYALIELWIYLVRVQGRGWHIVFKLLED